MRVLGVDPGTISCGYGIVDDQTGEQKAVIYGAIKCKQRSPMGERLLLVFNTLDQLISEYKPDVIAVESPFVSENAKTAIAIGKAQAMALLAAAKHNLDCYEYAPRIIKRTISNYGAADKTQMQRIVMILLGLKDIPEPNDAADALAIAMTHFQETQMIRLEERTK